MAQYKITYNPYSNDVIIEKEGNVLPQNNRLCSGIRGKRLQTWFDVCPGWEGFAEELCKNNNEEKCSIQFCGRSIDYDDLKAEFQLYCKNHSEVIIETTLESCHNDTDILQRLGNLMNDIKEKSILTDVQIQDIENKIESLKSDYFAISVLATMSSGKSTLLNSLLSANILPVGNRATTANIVEIYDNDGQVFEVETFDKNGNMIGEKQEASAAVIKDINANKEIHTAKVYGDIPFVNVGRMSLMLRDTPGPNSQVEEHGAITSSIISDPNNQSTVIYVMDTTKPEDKSDGELLSEIAEEMKQGDRLTADRFFFVVNKADDWVEGNDGNDQTMDKLISETREYLNKYGIENPRIYPVTADLALKIRRKNAGDKFNPIAEKKFENKIEIFSLPDYDEIQFSNFASTSNNVKEKIKQMLDEAIAKEDKYTIALINSGIIALELSIHEYMEKYAYPIKISDAVKDILDTIDDEKMRNEFSKSIAENENQLNKVEKQIGELKEKKEDRLAKRNEFEKKVKEYEIPKRIKDEACQSVQRKIKEAIDNTGLQINSERKTTVEEGKQIFQFFQREVKKIEEEVQVELEKELKKELYDKAENLLNDFRNYITQIKSSLVVDSFDFGKVKKIKAFDLGYINTNIDKYSTKKYFQESKIERKSEEKKFLFFKFKVYKKVEVLVNTDQIEATYVNAYKLNQDMIAVGLEIVENIEEIFKFSNEELEAYKIHFSSEIQQLGIIIEETLSEISQLTENQKLVDKEKLYYESRLADLNEVVGKIKSITKVEG